MHTLEDYMVLHDEKFPVIVRSDAPRSLLKNLMAASLAYRAGSPELGVARRHRYCRVPRSYTEPPPEVQRYRRARALIRGHVGEHRDTLRLASGSYPCPGRNAATIAVVRLDASFSAALVLIRSGLRYEAMAVNRMIVEQLAWAVAVADLQSMERVEKTEPQSCIAALKRFVPEIGRLYGALSNYAHMGLNPQAEYVAFSTPTEATRVTARFGIESLVDADLLLVLADAYAMITEYLAREDLPDLRSIQQTHDHWSANPERPFLRRIAEYFEAHEG